MGVLNAEGASNMDEAQWEAASEFPVVGVCLELMSRFVYGFRLRESPALVDRQYFISS